MQISPSENKVPCSVWGIPRTRGARILRRLSDHSVIGFYRPADRSVNAFVTKHGREATQALLARLVSETA